MPSLFVLVENGVVVQRSKWLNDTPPEGQNWIADEGAQIGWTYDDQAKTFAPPVVVALNLTAAELKEYAKGARKEFEYRGVDVGGVTVKTDVESQGKVADAHGGFSDGTITGTLKFKSVSGFVDADATMIAAVRTAIIGHVQDAYSREEQVWAGVDAGTITTTAEIDAIFA